MIKFCSRRDGTVNSPSRIVILQIIIGLGTRPSTCLTKVAHFPIKIVGRAHYHVHVQLGCIAQGLLQHLALNHTAEVWRCFRSWLRTMNPTMPPSELIVANALRYSIPTLFTVPALAPGLTKIMEEYRRHDPPSELYEMAA